MERRGARPVVIGNCILLIALCLFPLVVFAAPPERGPLDPDPQLMRPFECPWLLTIAQLNHALANLVPARQSHRDIPRRQVYALTPDPFDWSLASTSPDEDNWAYLPTLPPSRNANTAQKLASLHTAHPPHAPASRSDVSRIGIRDVGEGLNFYSIEKEIALGRELAVEVEQTTRLFPDPIVNEFVNRTGQTLVRHSDCKVPFTIKVVDDDEVNAFALPGGFFYVNTGAIMAAANEAELAGIMAHEIAHVCARHATRNLTKNQIAQYASIPLVFVGGPVGYVARELSSMAVPLSFFKFSRDAEREADMLGIQYQYAAGYDPTSFVDFFEKLEMEEKDDHNNFIARAFSSHPMTDDRVKRAESMLEGLPGRDSYVTDSSEFDEVHARLLKLTHPAGFIQRPHPTLRRRNGKSD
jgi:predicted Zn-dependent protease